MPGCGKSSIIRALELKNCHVVEEAATDIIAYEQSIGNKEPWKKTNFISKITHLQKQRQQQSDSMAGADVFFYDRSPFCTYALAIYLGFELSGSLKEEIEFLQKNETYQKRVFFIENLGFIKNTDARQISYAESLKFEEIHLETYKKFGYECIFIKAAPVLERVDAILTML